MFKVLLNMGTFFRSVTMLICKELPLKSNSNRFEKNHKIFSTKKKRNPPPPPLFPALKSFKWIHEVSQMKTKNLKKLWKKFISFYSTDFVQYRFFHENQHFKILFETSIHSIKNYVIYSKFKLELTTTYE